MAAVAATSLVPTLSLSTSGRQESTQQHFHRLSPSLPPSRQFPLAARQTGTTPSPRHLPRRLRTPLATAEPAQMTDTSAGARKVVKVPVIEATPASFAPFGTIVEPVDDGGEFGPHDAQLDLTQGQPRVYLMRLRDRKLGFDNITHHAGVTQCLAAAGNGVWYLGLAPASVVDTPEAEGCVKSNAGHWYRPPSVSDIKVFKFQGPSIAKLHKGTWHAGPLFTDAFMDFFNLELADTNVVDHTTHYFGKDDNVEFEFDP